MPDIIEAPFTPEQVVALNTYQRAGVFHPFTCADRKDHPEDERDKGCLVATMHGWICPVCWDGTLEDMQDWAHRFMATHLSLTDLYKAAGIRIKMQPVNKKYEWLHKYSSNNKEIISTVKIVGCFYCRRFYSAASIKDWVGTDSNTAVCKCGINSILPSSINYCDGDEMEKFTVTQEVLNEMRNYWFD